MRKHGFIMLILALFLVSMPVLAVDLESINSFSQEIQETTTINSQEELAVNSFNIIEIIKCETLSFDNQTLLILSPAHPWEIYSGNSTGFLIVESDDPNDYIYSLGNRRYIDHPSFLGVA